MSRLLRERRGTEGKVRPARRGLARGPGALGLLATALISGSCLVTNQFEFATPDTPPTVTAISPKGFTHLPRFGDPQCVDIRGDALLFKAVVREPDPLQTVWYHLFINGNDVTNAGLGADQLPAQPNSDLRTIDGLCVLHSLLSRLCNRVQLVVSHDYDDVKFAPIDSDVSGRYNVAQWFVVGKAQQDPTANPSDCAQLVEGDSGLTNPLADGSVIGPPADGGTIFPVASEPGPGDGGS
jgi:hypothetical protein